METLIRGDGAASPGRPRFVHLKVHSAYSLLEGALQVSDLAKLAGALRMPAVGLTDTNNMFGVLEFSETMAAAGIQPIVGCALQTDFGDQLRSMAPWDTAARLAGPLALLARNEAGYLNLMKLASACHLNPAASEPPHVRTADIERHSAGLIALTGGPDGPIDSALRAGQQALARLRLRQLAAIFPGTLYVELQRHGLAHEQEAEPELLQLAYELGLPIVATNECYFARPEDHEAHDVLLCIAEGSYVVEDNRRRVSREHYFKSSEQMAELFAELPEALDSTVEIAKRCAYRPTGRKPILPSFVPVAPGASAGEQAAIEAEELRRQAQAGLARRLDVQPLAPGYTVEDYRKRLEFELDVIASMRFPGYFLIVANFIKWAKAHGIPVGPGRGSGAGSLAAWALTITDLDPLRFGLLFERFLNPERVSMPDFDVDFCQDRRDEVIRYVQGKYGADRVAQIITHGKLQARAVLRDVGRALHMPYPQIDKLAKLVPNNPVNPVTLPQAIEAEPKLQEARDSDPMVARLLEIAQKLEGLYRHASTHAAGIVIGDRPLDELVPLYRDPKSSLPVTQFNGRMVEAAGLVKFDFLGLKTLTVLEKTVQLVKRGRGIDVDLLKVSLDDRPSYELLAKADTVGVFQLESTGMRDSLKRLRPDRFEDIIAMVALYRPGPMDNILTYISRKHGEERVDCLHPLLEPILKETYGVVIYQEQVMQIAQVLSGYSLGEADLLRRAMGKKDKSEMARQKSRFVEGAMRNGVRQPHAEHIFELVAKFASYGFNKSHAAAYALVAYHTAYLKANFREEFLAASMTLDMGNTDKLAMYAAEARKSGIAVLPPCINESEVEFLARAPLANCKGTGAIRYSLAALKNIGTQAVESVVAARRSGGPFRDISDFAARSGTRVPSKRALQTLAAAGAFDALEANRAWLHHNADQIVSFAHRLAADTERGIADLFQADAARAGIELRSVPPWPAINRLHAEFEAVGFYLSGHPLDAYRSPLARLNVASYAEMEAMAHSGPVSGSIAAIVVSARERRSHKGNKFAFALFSEPMRQFEAVIFADTLAVSRELLEPGTAVLLSVEGESEGDLLKLRVRELRSLDEAVKALAPDSPANGPPTSPGAALHA